jgi:hypothetical protein
MAHILNKAQSKMLKLNYYAALNSRILLYFILFLSIVDLLFFVIAKEYISVIIFILIGVLTSFFSKNMMVIFTIAMVCTNILRFGNETSFEGMTEESNDDETLDAELKKELNSENFEDEYLETEKEEKIAVKKETPSTPTSTPTSASATKKNVSNNEDPSTDMAGLDKQTQNLLDKQTILLKNMDNLDPLLKKAETFMEKFQSLNSVSK